MPLNNENELASRERRSYDMDALLDRLDALEDLYCEEDVHRLVNEAVGRRTGGMIVLSDLSQRLTALERDCAKHIPGTTQPFEPAQRSTEPAQQGRPSEQTPLDRLAFIEKWIVEREEEEIHSLLKKLSTESGLTVRLNAAEERLTDLESVCAKLKHQLPADATHSAAPASAPAPSHVGTQPACHDWCPDAPATRESVWVDGCGYATAKAVEDAYALLRRMRRLPSVDDELSAVRAERDSAYLDGYEAGCRITEFKGETLAQIQSDMLYGVDARPQPVVDYGCKPAATEPSNASPA